MNKKSTSPSKKSAVKDKKWKAREATLKLFCTSKKITLKRYPARDFLRITFSSDRTMVWTINLLHEMQFSISLCKKFVVQTLAAWKVSKYRVFSGPYLDTFHAVNIFLLLLKVVHFCVYSLWLGCRFFLLYLLCWVDSLKTEFKLKTIKWYKNQNRDKK